MKLYTFFTDTHKIFLKYFLNSYKFNEDLDLVIRYLPQQCETGDFMTSGWNDTMKLKVKYILDALNETEDGEVFIHSDCDVLILKDIHDEVLHQLGDKDIVFQSDVGTPCMGFFICRCSDKTKLLFTDVYNRLDEFDHDQDAVIKLLREGNQTKYKVDIGLFSNMFFNYGMNGCHYKGEDTIRVPSDIYMFHANFCAERDNKIKLIKKVNQQFGL